MFDDDEYVVIDDFNAKRADAADLIVLPGDVPGKNCANCSMFSGGKCIQKQVNMKVQPHWSCRYWSNPKSQLASAFMAQSDNIARLSRSPKVMARMRKIYEKMRMSRFDCGHDEDGGFSHGNTCGSLRGSSSSESSKPKHASPHHERVHEINHHIKEMKHPSEMSDKELDHLHRMLSERQKHIHHARNHDEKAKSEKEKPKKESGFTSGHAIEKLDHIKKHSSSMSSTEIESAIDKMGSSLSTGEVKEVQKRFLGASIGKNKQEMIDYIKKDIHNYRRSEDRVSGILKS